MFNIGLSEFLIIGVLALILLGPDQLPSAIRTLAGFIRDIRRTVLQVKDQIDPEFHSVTRDLQDAIQGEITPKLKGDLTPQIRPAKPKAQLPVAPETPALPAAAAVEEGPIIRPPSLEEGAPVARGAVIQPETPAPQINPILNEGSEA